MVHVRVTEGILEGELVDNEFGGRFYSFKGVPYAAPPVGDLRFKAPQPPKPWDGVRSAKNFEPICYQFDLYTKTARNGSEDCLYLNIYTPEIEPEKPLPVMFWIHGGGLVTGSGNDDLYGPEFLVRQGVILVTINYRLEVLGFLCLHTKEISGNAGMKDQVAALRWIQNNIKHFGGDNKNVTIFGESAGGACCSYHLSSPMSKGLFKRAIMQSGTSTNFLSNTFLPREKTLALARQLGCGSTNDEEIASFLISQPVENLVNKRITLTYMEECKDIRIGTFGVVVEKKFEDNERFLVEDIYGSVRKGIHEGVDVMNGYTEDEALICLVAFKPEELIARADKFLEFFVSKPIALNLPITEQLKVGKRFKDFYFNNKEVTKDSFEQLLKYISADCFVYSAIFWQKVCAKQNKNKIYLYKFSCKSERNVFQKWLSLKVDDIFHGRITVSHGDDLPYLFPFKTYEQKIEKKSRIFAMIDKVTKLWTNFAKFGNPTPDNSLGEIWKPYTLKDQNYLDIGEQLVAGKNVDGDEMQFWESIFKEYYPHISI